jgi:hypothetical protein
MTSAIGCTEFSVGTESAAACPSAGKRNIEGLLPDVVRTTVYPGDAELVQEATQGTKDEWESTRNRLKSPLLEESEKSASPGPEYFRGFYPLAKMINSTSN